MSGERYSEAVRQRCREPRRAGHWPVGTPRVATGTTGSLDDGAWAELQVQVGEGDDVIADARFRVFGCSAAVASASFVADAMVGASPVRARQLQAERVAEALALPPEKHAMAALAVEAARAALDDWEQQVRTAGVAAALAGTPKEQHAS